MATGNGLPIVGRFDERQVLADAIERARRGPLAVVVEGEAGIGKTELWREAMDAATDAGLRILRCRPTETETHFTYAALGDLLVDVEPAVLDELPGPQRQALEVAMLREAPPDEPIPDRAVGLALLGVLRRLAAADGGPLIVGIDDAHWLDGPTEHALAFATRRLAEDEPVAVLATRRPVEPGGYPTDLAGDLTGGVRTLQLGPLGDSYVDQMLEARFGGLPRRSREPVHRAAGGNPFFAVELARAAMSEPPVDGELAVPPNLQILVGVRLDALGADALAAVELAATASRPTESLLATALGPEVATTALDEAAAAHVLVREGDRIRFSHPLLASVAAQRGSIHDRRARHRRLAAAVGDTEERARHLALGAVHADARVAAEVDAGADAARRRGIHATAAELYGQAIRLTPPSDVEARAQRCYLRARCLISTGDFATARAIFDDLLATNPSGLFRARVLEASAPIIAYTVSGAAPEDALADALEHAGDDRQLRVDILVGLAWSRLTNGDFDGAREMAAAAIEVAEDLGDPQVLAGALGVSAFFDTQSGRPGGLATYERALALAPTPEWAPILARRDFLYAVALLWSGQLEPARARLEAVRIDAVERGDDLSLPMVLHALTAAEIRLGNVARAAELARMAETDIDDADNAFNRVAVLCVRAMVDAHSGALDAAAAAAEEGLRLTREVGNHAMVGYCLALQAFVHLSRGEHGAAAALLPELSAASGGEIGELAYHGDLTEALLGQGDVDRAAALTSELEARAATGQPWAAAIAPRARGLVLAARGDVAGATSVLEAAVGAPPAAGPFEAARTWLALGIVRRRARHRAEARAALREALGRFEALGDPVWAERARAELARTGGSAGNGGAEALTPTEQRVATLIAAGRTYREAADELFISPKTVQANLSKVYRKLGIRSRAELPGKLPPAT